MAVVIDLEKPLDHEVFLTTIDNPYDPRKQFDEWYTYDSMLGYNTLSRLDRLSTYLKSTIKTDDPQVLWDHSIKELVRLDPLGVYRVVS